MRNGYESREKALKKRSCIKLQKEAILKGKKRILRKGQVFRYGR